MTPPEVQPVDVSIRDLEARWGLSRNGLKARAARLGVELRRVSSTLTVWPGEFVELGDRLHEHLSSGQPLHTFPGLAPAVSAPPVPSRQQEPEASGAGLVPAPAGAVTAPEPTTIEPRPVASQALISPDLLPLLQQLAPPPPPVDPLQRARGLAEAADAGLVLANDDMAALLGHGVSSWRDGHEAYGYSFRRHQQGRQVLWTVARAIASPAVSAPPVPSRQQPSAAASERRRPGFAVDARAVVVSRLELPSWLPHHTLPNPSPYA